jgi:hypothetical protein
MPTSKGDFLKKKPFSFCENHDFCRLWGSKLRTKMDQKLIAGGCSGGAVGEWGAVGVQWGAVGVQRGCSGVQWGAVGVQWGVQWGVHWGCSGGAVGGAMVGAMVGAVGVQWGASKK